LPTAAAIDDPKYIRWSFLFVKKIVTLKPGTRNIKGAISEEEAGAG